MKLVKEELDRHLKQNLIAGSTELVKDSVLKAQSKCIPSTKQVQKEQIKVSISEQQGKGGKFKKIERVMNWQIKGNITIRQAKRESEE